MILNVIPVASDVEAEINNNFKTNKKKIHYKKMYS